MKRCLVGKYDRTIVINGRTSNSNLAMEFQIQLDDARRFEQGAPEIRLILFVTEPTHRCPVTLIAPARSSPFLTDVTMQ